MTGQISRTSRWCCTVLVAAAVVLAGAGPVLAEQPGRHDRGASRDKGEYRDRGDYRDKRARSDRRKSSDDSDYRDYRGAREYRDGRDRDRRYTYRNTYRDYRRGHEPPRIVHRGRTISVPRDRVRRYRDIVIVRPYGHWYSGYGHYHHDNDAWKWLAFTAITLGVLNYLNEEQQREHEAAQVAATTAPIGERIIWEEGDASGSVIAIREGTSTSGRYCREFQHDVRVGGRTEEAYGTACRNPDGSWEVVSSESR